MHVLALTNTLLTMAPSVNMSLVKLQFAVEKFVKYKMKNHSDFDHDKTWEELWSVLSNINWFAPDDRWSPRFKEYSEADAVPREGQWKASRGVDWHKGIREEWKRVRELPNTNPATNALHQQFKIFEDEEITLETWLRTYYYSAIYDAMVDTGKTEHLLGFTCSPVRNNVGIHFNDYHALFWMSHELYMALDKVLLGHLSFTVFNGPDGVHRLGMILCEIVNSATEYLKYIDLVDKGA